MILRYIALLKNEGVDDNEYINIQKRREREKESESQERD